MNLSKYIKSNWQRILFVAGIVVIILIATISRARAKSREQAASFKNSFGSPALGNQYALDNDEPPACTSYTPITDGTDIAPCTSGKPVERLQKLLNDYGGQLITVDGIYGQQTWHAVRALNLPTSIPSDLLAEMQSYAAANLVPGDDYSQQIRAFFASI